MTMFVISGSKARSIDLREVQFAVGASGVMWGYGKIIGALAAAIVALAAAALLSTAPDAARWALLICSLGFVGATLRLHQLDERSRL